VILEAIHFLVEIGNPRHPLFTFLWSSRRRASGSNGRLREKLRTDGDRIQREIEEYSRLSQQVMQLTKTMSDSVEKVRASADGPARGPQKKE
jgi:hypothetical protein